MVTRLDQAEKTFFIALWIDGVEGKEPEWVASEQHMRLDILHPSLESIERRL